VAEQYGVSKFVGYSDSKTLNGIFGLYACWLEKNSDDHKVQRTECEKSGECHWVLAGNGMMFHCVFPLSCGLKIAPTGVFIRTIGTNFHLDGRNNQEIFTGR
jgi:hypothetical protein